jgi:hypothetical protein
MGIRLTIRCRMGRIIRMLVVLIFVIMMMMVVIVIVMMVVIIMIVFVTSGSMGVAWARGGTSSGVQKLGGLHMVGEYCLSQGLCLRFTQFLLGLVDHLVEG